MRDCYDGMAHHQVADIGTAMNKECSCEYILNKESRTADNGCVSILWVGRGANNSIKHILLLNVHTESLGPGLIIWYDPRNGKET